MPESKYYSKHWPDDIQIFFGGMHKKKCQEDRLKYDKVVVEGIPFSTIFLNHS